ncbi:Hypothetical predicted protein [Pelobates cultripes]|uniref:Uncharacterized protein n=1 Tax=Pelobates cultripes TaxID=61616 RepID=A0AAD1S029_PELCU|nr:Hypothetical predicted protein [Pelobates cultripes]
MNVMNGSRERNAFETQQAAWVLKAPVESLPSGITLMTPVVDEIQVPESKAHIKAPLIEIKTMFDADLSTVREEAHTL